MRYIFSNHKACTWALMLIITTMMILCTSCQYKQTREVMNTFAVIRSHNLDNIGEAYRELERISLIMDIYNENSEIYQLNKYKELPDNLTLSDELMYVVEKSIAYSEITEGSFDITISPLLQLYKRSFSEHQKPPADEQIKDELEKVSYKNIVISDIDNRIILKNSASIDLGGIAKGYAIDRALEIIGRGSVNIGGDLRIKGTSQIISLANPEKSDDYITRFRIRDGCIATSGNYERFFDREKKVHHIMDPKTGKSVQGLISVTIIGNKKKAIDCDALATGVFVMGKEKGLEVINSLDGFEALIIDDSNNIFRSRNLKRFEI